MTLYAKWTPVEKTDEEGKEEAGGCASSVVPTAVTVSVAAAAALAVYCVALKKKFTSK